MKFTPANLNPEQANRNVVQRLYLRISLTGASYAKRGKRGILRALVSRFAQNGLAHKATVMQVTSGYAVVIIS